jgi:protein-tyrosine kinase
MSRIHEALKRAAEERERHEHRDALAALLPVRNEIAIDMGEKVPAQAPKSELDPASFRFDQIISRCVRTQWKYGPESDTSQWGDNGRAGAEGFRTLRSRLYQISDARPLRRLLISSSQPNEGKTFVAVNLALSIVRQPDRRVLLIDADLRAGSGHKVLGAPNDRGLSDYLKGEADEYQVIQSTSNNKLCFVSVGTPVSNPSELLLSDRMSDFLDRVTPAFDWVILDSPPALAVHDPSRLADLCDGVLFVVRASVTKRESATKALSEFQRNSLLGVVLNRVDKDEMQDSYYGYYGN